MLFIYNDNWFKIIENEQKYNKLEFTIVRKLFLQLNKKYAKFDETTKSFTVASIREDFIKFGVIESIEILNNNQFEAYVTFKDNGSAAIAFSFTMCENQNILIRPKSVKWLIEPANTWHQPFTTILNNELQYISPNSIENEIDEPSQSSPILTLFDECFDNIFKFCDLDSMINLMLVSRKFYYMLIENRSRRSYFGKFRKLTISVTNIKKNEYTTVGAARRKLLLVGKYIEKLKFHYDERHFNCSLRRYLHKIEQYVGENIRELVINDLCLYKCYSDLLKKVMGCIRVLKIINNLWSPCMFVYDYHLDLQTLCPNLIKLKLDTESKICDENIAWPKLKFLTIINGDHHMPFVENNEQLEGIKIQLSNESQIQVIVRKLHNLRKLAIANLLVTFSPKLLNNLSILNLTQLTLSYLNQSTFDDILVELKRFSLLQVLKLHIDRFHEDGAIVCNQKELIGLMQSLFYLKKLLLFNIYLDYSTLVNIILYATSLEIFHCHDSGTAFTNSLILQLVNIRTLQQQRNILKLFVDTREACEILRNTLIQLYLQVHYGCTHRNFDY